MLLIYIELDTGQGIVGRIDNTDNLTAYVTQSESNMPWYVLKDPVVAAVTTAPVFNERGEVQLTNGKWADPKSITDPNQVNMTMQGSKFIAYDVPEICIKWSTVRNVRELKRTEVERYDAALKSALAANSKLLVGGAGIINE